MSRYEQKKAYKAKYQEKHHSKFGFVYDENQVDHRTTIPDLPQKPKAHPDDKHLQKKKHEIEAQITKLKEERKENKEQIKKLDSKFNQEMDDLKKKTTLAHKCLKVLNYDLNKVKNDLQDLDIKITRRSNTIKHLTKDLKSPTHSEQPVQTTNKIEEMSLAELTLEERKVEEQMSVAGDKKVELSLANLLNKIKRLKAQKKSHGQIILPVPQRKKEKGNELIQGEIETKKTELEKLKKTKEEKQALLEQLSYKIQCTIQDRDQFIRQMNNLADKQEEDQLQNNLIVHNRDLKIKIDDLQEQITKLEDQFKKKVYDYEYEQQNIKWIQWATEVQEKKREEWEKEKAEKKRQRLKGEKAGQKSDAKQGAPSGETVYEKKKFNKNQKQIDICAYLIQYCKSLIPNNQEQQESVEKSQKNLQEQLKKGDWAKSKGLQVIQSKKHQKDEEQTTSKGYRKRDRKQSEEQTPAGFVHNYHTQSAFDAVHVLPPSVATELDKTIELLDDKLEYYLSHPDEVVESPKNVESKTHEDKKVNEKYVPAKYSKYQSTKKVINSQDFPSII